MFEINKNITGFIEDMTYREQPYLFRMKRMEAANSLRQNGFVFQNQSPVSVKFMKKKFALDVENANTDIGFNCTLENFSPLVYCLVNGRNIVDYGKSDNKIIVENIMNVADKVNELFGSLCDIDENGFYALNTAAFTGGFYIEVPDNTVMELPLQLVSVFNSDCDGMFNVRNLIVLGKNSQLKLIQCDDTFSDHDFFVNNLTEIFVREGAHLDYYKLHNISNDSAAVNSVFIEQESHSVVKTFNMELNAGYLSGNQNVVLGGDFAETYAYGIYLADREQEMDNYVNVEHIGTDCVSQQIFKGIIDDSARSMFTGKIIVHRDSQRTEASQVDKNILLTSKAKAYAKPYLEIYADDVKCSHGATVGQLDEEALFYMQQRGISYENARKLLLNAFVAEVIDKINIEPIKMRVSDMVKKRLMGELTVCDNCVLRCSNAKRQTKYIDNI